MNPRDPAWLSAVGGAGWRSFAPAAACLLAMILGGCRGPAPARDPFAPLPLNDAVHLVNENVGKITGTLRAVGATDGFYTDPNGARRSYHVDGTLFYLAPSCLRFDLKSFGDRKLLIGSNRQRYWYYDGQENDYHCGRHGMADDLTTNMPVQPAQLLEALGLTRIPTADDPSASPRLAQRIHGDHQQVLFLRPSDPSDLIVEKEYWLDGYPPRLVRRVLFRNRQGEIEMDAALDDYRALTADGPMLPHEITVDWRTPPGRMRFRVNRWTLVEQVLPDSPQFATPAECAENQP